MQPEIARPRFLVGSCEDFVLESRKEIIARDPTPLTMPSFNKDAPQEFQDSSRHEDSLQIGLHNPSSTMDSQSHVELSSSKSIEQWKAVTMDSQLENQILNSQIVKVEAQNKYLVDARGLREKMTEDPTETILYGLLQQNWQQTQTIRKLKDASFMNMDGPDEVRVTHKNVNACVEKIRMTLGSIMYKNGIKLRSTLDIMNANSDLRDLLGRLFGAEVNLKLERTIKDLDPQLLLRCLALAAVSHWIFMTDFPGLKENCLSRAQIKIVLQKGTHRIPCQLLQRTHL